MITSKLEVLVDLGDQPDKNLLERTLNELKSQDGVRAAKFKDGAFYVETTLPSAEVLELVSRSSGRRAVLQGFGESQSAVAMVSGSYCNNPTPTMGVVRFTQTGRVLIADGTVDGLAPGLHGLHVHDTGDLSQGCSSLGPHWDPYQSPHGGPNDPPEWRHAGDLGNIAADETGRSTFRIYDSVLKIDDIIGRSVSITENGDDLGKGPSPASKVDGNAGKPIACGIIARSAGVFQNPKRICLCDGVVVWDERDRPLAGKGRRVENGEKKEKKCNCQKHAEVKDERKNYTID